MMRKWMRYAALLAAVGLGACDDTLAVTNPNAGETKRVMGTPDDAETLLGSYYRRWHGGLYGTANPPGNFEGMANIMSLMNYSSLANNCQNQRAPFTGATNSNAPGNSCSGEQANPYFVESEVNRVASNFIAALDSGLAEKLGGATSNRVNRDRAFAEFLRGMSLGYIALFYDSAGVISPTMGTSAADCVPDSFSNVCTGKLVAYKEVMDSALAAFQRAITHATAPGTGGGGFPLPSTWIPSPTSFTSAEFVRLIRSYRARFRASVARTPAERAAVDWAAVIADAQNGITGDHFNTTSTTQGLGAGWRRIMDGAGLWHQMTPFIIGMADVSGSYASWIAQPVSERGSGSQSFFMITPDLRFPQGATRAAQQSDFTIQSCQGASQTCKRYFVNRPSGNDQNNGAGWGWSNYDLARFHSWTISGDGSARNGNLVFFTKTELDMLQAEGLIRTGSYAAAAALINVTRTRNGLPEITAFDNTSPVPGDANCVPKVPVGPNFNTIACGNMMEAMKYEKRIETVYTHFAAWFLDMRGWGDLPQGTPLFWAVPYQDLQARGYALAEIYGSGVGTGNAPNSAAAKGTYGW